MKRAQYFLTCGGRYASPLKLSQEGILQNLMAVERRALPQAEAQPLSHFGQDGKGGRDGMARDHLSIRRQL